ncbi:hypothetical protein OH687_32445 [Burkholderia anthina]|nr:hypothetical protein OH687_32445 [Burkholderia anthina]
MLQVHNGRRRVRARSIAARDCRRTAAIARGAIHSSWCGAILIRPTLPTQVIPKIPLLGHEIRRIQIDLSISMVCGIHPRTISIVCAQPSIALKTQHFPLFFNYLLSLNRRIQTAFTKPHAFTIRFGNFTS